MRKIVLRAETCFAIIGPNQKNHKFDFFVIPVGEKGFLVSGVFLEVINGTQKMVKLETMSFANSGTLSDPRLLYYCTSFHQKCQKLEIVLTILGSV